MSFHIEDVVDQLNLGLPDTNVIRTQLLTGKSNMRNHGFIGTLKSAMVFV